MMRSRYRQVPPSYGRIERKSCFILKRLARKIHGGRPRRLLRNVLILHKRVIVLKDRHIAAACVIEGFHGGICCRMLQTCCSFAQHIARLLICEPQLLLRLCCSKLAEICARHYFFWLLCTGSRPRGQAFIWSYFWRRRGLSDDVLRRHHFDYVFLAGGGRGGRRNNNSSGGLSRSRCRGGSGGGGGGGGCRGGSCRSSLLSCRLCCCRCCSCSCRSFCGCSRLVLEALCHLLRFRRDLCSLQLSSCSCQRRLGGGQGWLIETYRSCGESR
mmetsp:Transcript_75260/g.178817  ORF Transcript_75260/g.178817 Transcript_75260/m.178817 type:complete len:271 (-) Transcript_75260:1058-1870(-)